MSWKSELDKELNRKLEDFFLRPSAERIQDVISRILAQPDRMGSALYPIGRVPKRRSAPSGASLSKKELKAGLLALMAMLDFAALAKTIPGDLGERDGLAMQVIDAEIAASVLRTNEMLAPHAPLADVTLRFLAKLELCKIASEKLMAEIGDATLALEVEFECHRP